MSRKRRAISKKECEGMELAADGTRAFPTCSSTPFIICGESASRYHRLELQGYVDIIVTTVRLFHTPRYLTIALIVTRERQFCVRVIIIYNTWAQWQDNWPRFEAMESLFLNLKYCCFFIPDIILSEDYLIRQFRIAKI